MEEKKFFSEDVSDIKSQHYIAGNKGRAIKRLAGEYECSEAMINFPARKLHPIKSVVGKA